MLALILNSGLGTRLAPHTNSHPKCLTEIAPGETILSRQLKLLSSAGIHHVVMTTGYLSEAVVEACTQTAESLPLSFSFVENPRYRETNYIYSIYLARDIFLTKHADEDILLLHGDLVFDALAMDRLLSLPGSRMAVSSTLPLPEKDFKAVVENGQIQKVGIEFFENALAAQAMYKLENAAWKMWLNQIIDFCEHGSVSVYAENALNTLNGEANILPADMEDLLCAEIDNEEDLQAVSARLKEIENRTVYLSFSTDIIPGGHIAIIRKAQRLGRLVIGVLSDEAVASYKRFPLVPASERKTMFENIAGVSRVVEQKTLSYRSVLEELKPAVVVHGDDWVTGFQQPIRNEVIDLLKHWGGILQEYPYSRSDKYKEIEKRQRADLAMPDIRRGRLKRVLEAKGLVTAMEAHDGLTGLVVENTVVHENGGARQFDAMWLSSLCDSTAKGKPDIELVDMTSRFRTIDDIMEVTTKPIIFDGDTGGLTEHFVYTVRSLERMGVSMVIIEDKTGLKKNSLFGTEVQQTQDTIENFCQKIKAGKKAQRTKEFMICARIESLILEKGMEDALTRAYAFTEAGADAIMIHSRKKDPQEIFDFLKKFREKDPTTPIVLVPTSFNSVKEEEWKRRGANIIIYANQLMRAAVPAIQKAAETILENHRAEECDQNLMPFKDIIRLIPAEE